MKFAFRLAAYCALLVSCLCLAVRAEAHKVNVFAYVEKGRIVGEGYFSDGAKAQGAAVSVRDASGRELAAVVSGADGSFSLPLPQAAPPLTIVLSASEGHQNQYVLTAADIGPGAAQAPVPARAEPQASPAAPPADRSAPAALSRDATAEVVDQVVEARLAPLKAQLARLAEQGDRVSLKDVAGGLGWILGLFGVAAYAASRRGDGGRGTS